MSEISPIKSSPRTGEGSGTVPPLPPRTINTSTRSVGGASDGFASIVVGTEPAMSQTSLPTESVVAPSNRASSKPRVTDAVSPVVLLTCLCLAVAALVGAVTVAEYQRQVSVDRDRESVEVAFQGLASSAADFLDFSLGPVVGVVVNTAAALRATSPLLTVSQFEVLVSEQPVTPQGVSVIQRVAKSPPSVITEWEADMTAQLGVNVSVFSIPTFLPSYVDDPEFGYLLRTPSLKSVREFVGFDFGAWSLRRPSILALSADTPTTRSNLEFPSADGEAGASEVFIASSVFPDTDPTAFAVGMGLDMLGHAQRASTAFGVLIRITDPVAATSFEVTCALGDGDVDLSYHWESSLHVTPHQAPFRMEVVGCTSKLDTVSPGDSSQQAVYVAILALGVLLCAAILSVPWLLYNVAIANDAVGAAKAQGQQAAAADEAHRRIIGFLCHEQRNPMHVLKTWFRVLRSGASLTRQEQTGIWRDISDSLELMETTLNDVLDFRMLQDGGFTPSLSAASPRSLLGAAVRRCRTFVPHDTALQYHMSSPMASGSVLCDRNRVLQILTNAISNAGRFTPTGRIVVTASEVKSRRFDGGNFLVVDVLNTGSGLGVSDPELLFRPFSRAGATDSGGSLSSWRSASAPKWYRHECRSMWRRHLRGVQSVLAPGFGSLHTVAALREGRTSATQNSTGLGLPLARAFAYACGGWVGLEDAADGTTHFWCVVRADRSSVPAEVVETEAEEEEEEEGEEAEALRPGDGKGGDEYANEGAVEAKADSDELLTDSPAEDRASGRLLFGAASVSTSASQSPAPPLSDSLKVVIIDDEAVIRRIAVRHLTKAGVDRSNIQTLTSGSAWVSACASAGPGGVEVDVVLMDIFMPGMTGLEVMGAQRPSCPTIAVTADVSGSACEAYRQAGFTLCLAKPYSAEGLVEAIRRAVELGGGGGGGGGGGADTSESFVVVRQ